MLSKICFGLFLSLMFLNHFLWGSSHSQCWISNANPSLNSTPQFRIQTSKPIVEKIHWQISDNQEFDWISPELQNISNTTDEIVLSEESKKLLIPGETYYFRFKVEFFNKCTTWSKPFQFSIGSPKANNKEYHWKKNGSVDEVTWNTLQPYLLPSNHPLKPKLDDIFLRMRATATAHFMKRAGFESLEEWKWDKVFVAKHPHLKGYLIKAFLDDHHLMDDKILVNRIICAENIRSAIKVYGYQAYFKVPRKWLYQLPENPPTLPGLHQKNFILVVEDMDLVSQKENKDMFHNLITEKHLSALFLLINTLGLSDSVYIKNIPFSKDEKIAFVDTERYGLWPILFHKLTPKLNSKMKKYWKQQTTCF